RLPGQMVPSQFVTLDALPLTPNGKVDRKALPAPDASREASGRGYVAPRTPEEEVLCGIWAEVLGVERVGVEDNFFELGGHSLLATQVMSRLRDALGAELPLLTIFEAPSVATLTERVLKARPEGEALESPPLTRVPRGGELSLSFAQLRLWFVSRFEPDTSVYNIPVALRFDGRLDAAALAESLRAIVRRHEVLRTSFRDAGREPAQVVEPEVDFDLPITDLSRLPESEREAEALRLARREAARPFDLTRAPLVRARLVRLREVEHVLLLTMHHIVSDGWSLGVVVKELAALYGAFSAGEPSPLAPLPIQYADFAHWQRRLLGGEALEKRLAYWRRRLAGAPPVLELPTDRPRPAAQTHRGRTLTFDIPGPVAALLKALSRRENATLHMTLLACFKALLYRYTGQPEVVVGSPVAGRQRAEVEPLIGFFVNMLPLNTRLDGDLTFNELLARVRSLTLEAYAHQDVPFEKLVEELRPERSLSHAPFFQVAFALQNAPRAEPRLPGVTLSQFEVERATAKYDLTLMMAEGEGGLSASFEYSTDLFDATTIRRMSDNFGVLLAGVAADPGRRLSELPLLTNEERRRLLVEFNDTAREYPRHLCAHQLFEEQVRRAPDSVAVAGDGERLTYAELNARANRLARRLRRLGVGPESRVAILLERSPELVVSLLAVLKAGGCYVPLDPAYPEGRLRFMLEDSGAEVLLTDSALSGRLPGPARTLCLDAARERTEDESDADPRFPVDPSNLAYVIYTSGSTGVPKGISIPHYAINRLVFNTNYVSLGADERIAQASNSSFDAATFEIWGALLHGARLVIVSRDVTLSPRLFAGQIREQKITTLFLTTALFNQMAREAPSAFEGIRNLLFGGEAVEPRWVKEVLSRGAPVRLLHVYGPTESTTYASWHLVEGVPEGGATVPIGGPLSNTRIYLLDRGLRTVPFGVAGELYIGGDGLARGYLGRPGLTAERFVPDPFSGGGGERLYRTGDVCRYRPDGQIEFLGRLDQQVKLRGHRVEPGEVEAALGEHPAVRECAVVVREDVAGDKRLVAYVAAAGAAEAGGLREYLRGRLPEYMVPSAYVFLDALPLTPNGKVDRKALPAPDAGGSRGGAEYVAPRTAVEKVVAGIWSELLGVERVGVHDNFFDLGGHSLLATRILSHVREIFCVELPLRSLFESPTVDSMAEAMSRAAGREAVEEIARALIEIEALSEDEVKVVLLGEPVAE
ncbi:MAG TPA: amino acid adenylation domain-containing protein, partial [Pyrinomonadaceae bacterium]|nr:amino acid adenylation domain-containing protein [Pyrinomonadaceae bacterium]